MTRVIVGFAGFLAAIAAAAAQNWPARPVTMVVPFAAAGGADVMGRIVAARLSELLGQHVIVVNVTHVPYRGAAPAMQDLIAGRIDYGCFEPPITAPQVESNTVQAIAVLTKNRSPKLPSLASAHEQGLKDFEAYSWYGIFLPKGAPVPIVQKLHDATFAAMTTPSVQEKLQEIGATIVARERRTPEYLAKFVVSEIAKWVAPIRASNIQIE